MILNVISEKRTHLYTTRPRLVTHDAPVFGIKLRRGVSFFFSLNVSAEIDL